MSEFMQNFPKISVITPSFNQGAYLERTILSVLGQNYPNLEYIIIDGGSSDNSIEIIKKYESQLAYWVSEKDAGQSYAINKGLRLATGDWVAWQNSDDTYQPGIFFELSMAAKQNPSTGLIIGNMNLIDIDDVIINNLIYVKPTYRSVLAEGMVLANQAAFWKRSLHQEIGFLNDDMHFGFDYEWFLRILKTSKAIHVNRVWGNLREHEQTKTAKFQASFDEDFLSIREGREATILIKRYHQLRRLFLLVLQGDWPYALRGISRRLSGK
jgi:glycosyltransferase involved in cell wall biosynthesis